MIKKGGNFIEQHIEKAVLIIVGLLCVYVLFEYVLLSPNVCKYDNEKFTPSRLDRYIGVQAEKLKEQLNGEAAVKERYEPNASRFLAKMDCAVNVETNIAWPIPSSTELKIEKKYRIPTVGQVNDVSAEHIRAAAYVPTAEITVENVADEKSYEPNDIDLVTVQASFDIGALTDSFRECFAGKEMSEEWRDAGLARPVFAAVEVQRQRLGSAGQWGEWEKVPRAKISKQGPEFSVIEDVNGLPSGSVMVRLLKCSDPQKQVRLLQPEPYQIASADEDWFPPVLHKKFLANQKEKEAQEKRDTITAQREEERDKTRTERDQRRSSKASSKPADSGGRSGGNVEADYLKSMGVNPASRGITKGARERRPESSPVEQPKTAKVTNPGGDLTIYDEMDKILLKGKNLGELREPIVFWAYDDTAKPGSSYRYRIRLGVFNPVAGTGQVRAENAAYNSKVILWSDFSDVTEAVAIPNRLYFFPVDVQETAKAVDVQVCKYWLGYWHSEQFMVKRGDVIGKEVKVEPNEQNKDMKKVPETIDYTTGAVLVDLVAINDWSGDKNLQPRHYFDVLYSPDGESIVRVAAKLTYWPEDLRARYSEVKALEKKPKVALRAFSSVSTLGGRRMPGSPTDKGGAPTTSDEYMMQYLQKMKH
jgi:hypothetical protein